jgi:hypothetical protein
MCQCERSSLTFETLFTDPLIQLVMASDGVTHEELAEVLEMARSARATPGLPIPARVIVFPMTVPTSGTAAHA